MPTSRRLVDSNGADFYPTPSWATKALIDHEDFEGSIWEPACGDGAISKTLEGYGGYDVTSTDLYDRGYGEGGVDFIDYHPRVGNIIIRDNQTIA